jgi:VIT1/CCC1 family predicted Fe2+/Mn2+ transporter
MKYTKEELMLVATAFTFMILTLLIFFPIAEGNDQIFLALGSMMLGYFFGSATSQPRRIPPEPPEDGTP